MASSRETVGYPAKNSSSVCPRSSESNESWSGTRVPRNTGVPPKILGFLTITLSIQSPCSCLKEYITALIRRFERTHTRPLGYVQQTEPNLDSSWSSLGREPDVM